MKLALIPLNPIIGDTRGNANKIGVALEEAIAKGSNLVVFSELCLTGYPPKDFLFLPLLYENILKNLPLIKKYSKKTAIVIGMPTKNRGPGRPFRNTLMVINNGQLHQYHKQLLPNYDVFDECRYFEPGTEGLVLKIGGKKVGFSICEDIWTTDTKLKNRYKRDALGVYKRANLDLLVNISASPFELGKKHRRHKILHDVARKLDCAVAYVNQLGANDDLIFDGGAYVYNNHGKLTAMLNEFKNEILVVDLAAPPPTIPNLEIDDAQTITEALTLGLRDYVHKTGFNKVVLGLSGGIDSAVVAALAVRALGKENVTGIMLPSRYSSSSSITDSEALAKNLSIKTHTVKIETLHSEMEKTLGTVFSDGLNDITAQNIQARLRGNVLMAFANNTNALLLNTTNKSEMAMGYGTLYGDMCGAIAILGDLTKMQVYDVASYINRENAIIPLSILTKEPSAELKPNQRDADTLPNYDDLDPFVAEVIEHHGISTKTEWSGLDAKRTIKTMLVNEYKRHQAPIVLKISEKAFGTGRRMPVAARLL